MTIPMNPTSCLSSVRTLLHGSLVATLLLAMLAFASPATAQSRCDSCGTVVTTNRKDQKGSGTAGTVVGGVGGAVAGNLLGRNTTSTVVGGVGGAVAGNVVGRKLTAKKIWSVEVRMDRGDTRSVDFDREPGFRQGERVRITRDGALQRI